MRITKLDIKIPIFDNFASNRNKQTVLGRIEQRLEKPKASVLDHENALLKSRLKQVERREEE